MVGKAVLKRIQKEADAIAEAKWAEILTPELYARLEAAAAARLLAQLEISLANPEPEPEPEQPAEPELVFGSVEEFVRERIAPVYRREVIEGTSRNWCTQWWKHAEAISRLEACGAHGSVCAWILDRDECVVARSRRPPHGTAIRSRGHVQSVLGPQRSCRRRLRDRALAD